MAFEGQHAMFVNCFDFIAGCLIKHKIITIEFQKMQTIKGLDGLQYIHPTLHQQLQTDPLRGGECLELQENTADVFQGGDRFQKQPTSHQPFTKMTIQEAQLIFENRLRASVRAVGELDEDRKAFCVF